MSLQDNIKNAEAVIFAGGDGISFDSLKDVLEIDEKQLRYILTLLSEKYDGEKSGVVLQENGGNISLVTCPGTEDRVQRAFSARKNTPLSNAAMETLAIIAYNQPVSRAFIDQVRGVDSSSSLRTLINRGLVEEAGRLEIPGRPLSYKTTPVFLRSFSLKGLYDLPRVTAAENRPDGEEENDESDNL